MTTELSKCCRTCIFWERLGLRRTSPGRYLLPGKGEFEGCCHNVEGGSPRFRARSHVCGGWKGESPSVAPTGRREE